MTFKKSLKMKINQNGQSLLEYVLLTSIAIVALIASANFITTLKGGAFENHFNTVKNYIAPESMPEE